MIMAALAQHWRSAIALLLAVALACAPPFNVLAHNPAVLAASETERHAALGMTGIADPDHGHSHDDADPEERRPGHVHGHDPTDHSHDTGQSGLAAPGLGVHPPPPAEALVDRPAG